MTVYNVLLVSDQYLDSLAGSSLANIASVHCRHTVAHLTVKLNICIGFHLLDDCLLHPESWSHVKVLTLDFMK